MSEPGRMTDSDGTELTVEADGGTVVLDDGWGHWELKGDAKQEEFAQLYVAACHQAKVNAAVARAAADARLPGTAAVRSKVEELARGLIGIPDGP